MDQRFFPAHQLARPLQAFCYTARHGSMSRAAEELYLSQPTVSQQVRKLEEVVGSVLFERRGPHIQLTAEGEMLLQLAEPLVAGLENFQDEFRARLGHLEGGRVDIAAGESTILYILPELVAEFRERHAGIHVHLHNVTGRDGLSQIRQNEVDFAVGSMIEVPADIRYEPIYVFQPMLIMAPDHPLARKTDVTLEDISPYGLILPPKRLTTWRIVDLTFQKHEVPYQVVLEVGGWEVIKRYVGLGMGLSIVTSICLTAEDHLVARDMSAYFPQRSYGLVSRRGRVPSPQARRFIEALRKRRTSEAAALV